VVVVVVVVVLIAVGATDLVGVGEQAAATNAMAATATRAEAPLVRRASIDSPPARFLGSRFDHVERQLEPILCSTRA